MDILGIGIGPTQLLLILLVAFFVLGPERMPEVARQIARGIKLLRSYASDVQGQFGGDFGDLRQEFSSIQEDLSSIQGNLRSGLLDIDSSLRSVHQDVQSAVADVANPGAAPDVAPVEAAPAALIDYAPRAVTPPRPTTYFQPAADLSPTNADGDGRLPDFKPGA